MLLDALIFYEYCLTTIQPYIILAKHLIRTLLGPEPINYYLMDDGSVLPSNIALPNEIQAKTFVFDPLQNRITKVSNSSPEGRFKPLPYIGIQLKCPNETIDISDWLGDIRANPIPEMITPKQIMTLWSYSNNRYVSFASSTAHVVKNDGSEEDIEF